MSLKAIISQITKHTFVIQADLRPFDCQIVHFYHRNTHSLDLFKTSKEIGIEKVFTWILGTLS